ncbi:MAG TPA: amidohydrolase family protein [Terriglobia bacterium]|nr:amidohydrolase family protein [Terriglobia bacterium]
MRKHCVVLAAVLVFPQALVAQTKLSAAVEAFVRVEAPVIVLEHVRVIDGTGAAPAEDQTVVIEGGRIRALGASAGTPVPEGAKVLDLTGYTVIPGLVGMHDHMFYPAPAAIGSQGFPAVYTELAYSAPRLYLAAGVTSLRTTGAIEPYTDLAVKKLIDGGRAPGPKIHVTGPYLEGPGAYTPNMHELDGPDDARRTVDYWAAEGATSFKAYMHITRAELAAAVEAAHRHGLKITGHLCSIGFREAAALGIDDLEHGLLVDTEFVPGKVPDVCPPGPEAAQTLAALDVEGAPVQETIRDLVARHVAVTSTLPVFETFVGLRPPLDDRVLEALAPEARTSYLATRARRSGNEKASALAALELKKEMQFEHDFAQAGGLLLAGEDPTGYGGVLAGFGDQREVELLVEAGFTPLEAIHIATANGAAFLGELDRLGTLAPGKSADLAVIHGNPARDIADIEKVEIVFKDGVGYDAAKLIDSVRGQVGLR